jgi:hypothetical protein
MDVTDKISTLHSISVVAKNVDHEVVHGQCGVVKLPVLSCGERGEGKAW